MAADDQIGKLAQELMKAPLVTGAASAAFGAREKAAQAQEAMMSALNVPSGTDLEKLGNRLRSLSGRLEGIEDLLDTRLAAIEARLTGIEARLTEIDARQAAADARLAADRKPDDTPS